MLRSSLYGWARGEYASGLFASLSFSNPTFGVRRNIIAMAPFGQQKHYDYVIVGGGVAGLVLAARLSENPDKNVLVVEAGANRLDDENINVPGLMGKLWGNPGYDWDFWTEPQVWAFWPCLILVIANREYRPTSTIESFPSHGERSLEGHRPSTSWRLYIRPGRTSLHGLLWAIVDGVLQKWLNTTGNSTPFTMLPPRLGDSCP